MSMGAQVTPYAGAGPLWPGARDLGAVALLLDVDGTLLDIAPTPSSVTVPDKLRTSLGELYGRTGGALALVSGRTVGDLDRLFAPLRLPAIGAHGAEMRLADDRPAQRAGAAIGESVRRRFAAIAAIDPGVIVEDKGTSLAIHYRLAPQREGLVKQEIAAILNRLAPPPLRVMYGKAVVDITPPAFSKGAAVRDLMQHQPFANRCPVFVGDDTTDETVFAVLPMLGGRGYSVERPMAGASAVFASPREVRCWLAQLCGQGGNHQQ
jgi:trehalose 6-phosphate phosphatase